MKTTKFLIFKLLNSFFRSYGITYIVTILPKLFRLLSKKHGNFKLLTSIFLQHFNTKFPRFIFLLFGGFQVTEAILNSRKKKTKHDYLLEPSAAFLTSAIAFTSIPKSHRSDMCLFSLVRAIDAYLTSKQFKFPSWILFSTPTVLFQLSTWQIMYAWFYYPESLPKSFRTWISKLADMDHRILQQLRYNQRGFLH